MARKRRKSSSASLWVLAAIIVLAIAFIVKQNISNTAPQKTLSDLQVTACTAADNGGTCTTKLSELGFVLPEDCCQVLGKCCQ